MMLKLLVLLLCSVVVCEGVYVYSSFYAPLMNPRVLGYRVEVPFNHEAGVRARDQYQSQYGYRGERLIEYLGNGRGPNVVAKDNGVQDDVKLYYTYPGADSYHNQV